MTAAHNTSPLVTVVMPVYNGEATLRQSVSSVLDQSITDLELIIVNDASTDDTGHIARTVAAGDPRVVVFDRNQSGGPALARNDGIRRARGRYLAFCDADDLWLPDKLGRQISLSQETGAALVYSSYHRVSADFSLTARDFEPEGRIVEVPPMLPHSRLIRHNYIGNLTAMVDLELTGSIEMPDIQGAEDWALWLSIVREHGPAVAVVEPTALYRVARPGSHSSNRSRAIRAVWTVLRERERVPRLRAAVCLVWNIAVALRKRNI